MNVNDPKFKAVVADFLERAGWTAAQVFYATLLAGGTSVSLAVLPWKYASALAISAGVASLVLTALQYLSRTTQLTFWPDILVRLGKTFLASLAGSFAAAHPFNIVTFNWTTALNLAALATLTALGKGLLARGSTPAPSTPASSASAGDAPADNSTSDGSTPDGSAQTSGAGSLSAPANAANPSTLPTKTYLEAVNN